MEKAKIDDVVRRLKNKGAKGAVFLGAGCSSSAGIPMAAELITEIKTRFEVSLPDLTEPTYMNYMAQLDRRQRQELIIGAVRDRPVNAAHLALAYLMKAKKIDLVVTTNFDSLLPRACAIVGVDVAVYGIEALSDLKVTDIPHIGMPAVFYIHGQGHGFKQRNIAADFPSGHKKNVRKLLSHIEAARTFLVAGYSGENDPTAPLLWEPDYKASLYWIGYLDHDPARAVLEYLAAKKSSVLGRGS